MDHKSGSRQREVRGCHSACHVARGRRVAPRRQVVGVTEPIIRRYVASRCQRPCRCTTCTLTSSSWRSPRRRLGRTDHRQDCGTSLDCSRSAMSEGGRGGGRAGVVAPSRTRRTTQPWSSTRRTASFGGRSSTWRGRERFRAGSASRRLRARGVPPAGRCRRAGSERFTRRRVDGAVPRASSLPGASAAGALMGRCQSPEWPSPDGVRDSGARTTAGSTPCGVTQGALQLSRRESRA